MQSRWQSLSTLIASLQRQRDLETRVEEKLRLDAQIEDKHAERAAVEVELEQFERRATEARTRMLLLEAREAERKQSFEHAIACWRELAALPLPGHDAALELERLSQLKTHDEKRKGILRQMSPRFKEIAPVFKSVAEFLQRSAPESDTAEQLLIEQFVRQELDAQDFIDLWRKIRPEGGDPRSLDFSSLYRRLFRGEIAFFLGADLPHQFDTAQPTAQQLAGELAAEIQLQEPSNNPWPLSVVAEYFQMTPEHGMGALVQGLHARLRSPKATNPLYSLLSRIDAPLLIIVAGHDSQLEESFKRSGKRYVVVNSVISSIGGFYPGQILMRFSDRDQLEVPRLGEQLSELSLLEEGYSVLFKLRGSCPPPGRANARDMCSLVLSERSHFDFARSLDKVLPTYLSAKLATLGFWFLGFTPEQWEDRLLAGAILDSRRSTEPANVVRLSTSQFENAYWASRGVRRHAFELAEFVKQLEMTAR